MAKKERNANFIIDYIPSLNWYFANTIYTRAGLYYKYPCFRTDGTTYAKPEYHHAIFLSVKQ